jgi:undecaprenyl-diphosphatase
VAALCAILFAALVADLRLNGPVTRADAAISSWFHANAHPLLTAFFTALSHMHSTLAICLLALFAAAWLAWRRHTAWLPLLALCVPGGLVLNVLLKHAFQRARPVFDPPVSALTSYAFPSGHTAGATVWWGFALLLWFACEPRPGRRAAGCALAAAMVLLAGLSRVYLGVHYPSDVLAAMAEGAGWVVLCVAASQLARRLWRGRLRTP